MYSKTGRLGSADWLQATSAISVATSVMCVMADSVDGRADCLRPTITAYLHQHAFIQSNRTWGLPFCVHDAACR